MKLTISYQVRGISYGYTPAVLSKIIIHIHMKKFLNLVIGGLVGFLLAILISLIFGMFVFAMPEDLPLWGKIFFYCYIIAAILIGIRVAMEA